MRFFVGLHQPSDARHFDACMVSINRLRGRKSGFAVGDWIMDSGAFTTLAAHGRYIDPPSVYAEQIRRWASNGNLMAAVSQDFMCEAHMLEKTGLTIADHQRLTIDRYDQIALAGTAGVYLMPVLQGYAPEDYSRHLDQYDSRLARGAWVGVGSVCKRNGDPRAIEAVLLAIKGRRPDLRLHGFGVKSTALSSGLVRSLLDTADSMAWSFAARRAGGGQNDYRNALAWAGQIDRMPHQLQLLEVGTL